MARIRQEFVHTPFAKPGLKLQPVGNRTLVTLPVFFEVAWPGTGYKPDQVRTVTLLGHQVQIKPLFRSHTYHFGDGSSSGPVKSFGGPYPEGDITHPYPKAGRYTVSASTLYAGQFSVDGGPWMDIPGTVNIAGPGQGLQVLTAKNRLVTGDD